MRSLNNLQERFHQSFFFYLLPATNRYISIGKLQQIFNLYYPLTIISPSFFKGVYMPPFGLMIGSMLLKAVALYISRNEAAKKKQNWNLLQLGPLLLFSLVCGLLLGVAPELLTRINRTMELGLSTEDTVFGGFCILSAIHCVLFTTFGAR